MLTALSNIQTSLQALGSASEAQATEAMAYVLAVVVAVIAVALAYAVIRALFGRFIRQALRWAWLGLMAAAGAGLVGWGLETVIGRGLGLGL